MRAAEYLSKLRREVDQLNFNLQRTERDELVEVERVRREFATRRSIIGTKQQDLKDKIKTAEDHHNRLLTLVEQEKKQKAEEERRLREEERQRKLRL